MEDSVLQVMTDKDFLKAIQPSVGMNTSLCYQCKKCSAGCPIVYEMDYTPTQIIQAIRLGMKDLVLKSKTIWLCTSCETCATRCPQDIEITDVMDAARKIAVKERATVGVRDISDFYRSFVQMMKIFGRMYELGVILSYKLKKKDFKKDIPLGLKLIKFGKLKLFPDLTMAFKLNKMFSKVKKLEEERK
ncbi:MAG: 4Fe-4S dicluster domain-containing protein [Actinobacteria bacterium]|nr:4Fe-4S dicluster domain-containing protein [Actinomycetota bacterium]